MTTRSESGKSSTLDKVVGYNLNKLRLKRNWTATELAEQLTEVTGKPYTRFMVADLEGRRERAVRWVELAALCAIFDVALWDLVLPPEGVQVESRIAFGSVTDVDVTDSPPYDPEQATTGRTKGTIWHDYPDRDDLAWRIFGLDAESLASGALQKHARDQADKRDQQDILAIAEALLPRLVKGFEESDK